MCYCPRAPLLSYTYKVMSEVSPLWDFASFELGGGGVCSSASLSENGEARVVRLDEHGNVAELTDTSTGDSLTLHTTYDDQGRPTNVGPYAISYNADGSFTATEDQGRYYSFGPDGLPTSYVRPHSTISYANGVISGFSTSYDSAPGDLQIDRDDQGRTVRMAPEQRSGAPGSGMFAEVRFEYDESGSVSRMTVVPLDDGGDITVSFGYEKVYDPAPSVRALRGTLLP